MLTIRSENMGEATRGDAPQPEHIVRIPYSLEIEDKLPRGMPYPHQVAEQIAADMIASGQVRMQMWELLCDALPNGDPRRQACADLPGSMCFRSGAYSQGPLSGIRRNTTLPPWVTLLICKYIRSCTNVNFYELRAPTQYFNEESPSTHTNGTKHAHGEGTASPLPFTPSRPWLISAPNTPAH